MADGDIFSRHVRQWWKTTARKAVTGDQSFEASAIWSIEKMFRLGNCAGYPAIVKALAKSMQLQRRGIDSQVLLRAELEQIQREFPDSDTRSCVVAARRISQEFHSDRHLGSDETEQASASMGRRLLVELTCDYVGNSLLRDALLSEQGKHRRSHHQIDQSLSVLRRTMIGSDAMLELAAWQLYSDDSKTKTRESIREMIKTPDHQTLVFEAIGF